MDGRVDFKTDKDGRLVIWQRVSGPMEFTSMARRPFGEKVLRVRDGKLMDATAEFCGRILSDEMEDYRADQQALAPANLKKLEHAGEAGYDSSDYEEVVSALESRTIQHVFCRQYGEALKDLNLWPAGKREIVMKSFAQGIAQDYPEFAERLQEILNSK